MLWIHGYGDYMVSGWWNWTNAGSKSISLNMLNSKEVLKMKSTDKNLLVLL